MKRLARDVRGPAAGFIGSRGRLLPVAVLVWVLAGCGEAREEEMAFFRDLGADVAADFEHDPGDTGKLYFPEIMGAGGALFDYDGDGDLDLYAVQGGELNDDPSPGALPSEAAGMKLGDRLYRNDPGPAGPSFTDVTREVGLVATGYGMGAAVGDIDNDGDLDLYLMNYGANQLWRQGSDGRFEEVGSAAGVDDPAWSVGATFADFNGDGWLDLYVANYVGFSIAKHIECRGALGEVDYCSPLVYRPAPDSLYRNRGDGTFEDISTSAGIRRAPQNGLGVISLDADEDGRVDFYVANDMTPNHLFINVGEGRFEDRGLMAGVAVNAAGKAEASMGLAQADVDGDGRLDMLSTHLRGETHTLFRRERPGLFSDRTAPLGLDHVTLTATGFGAVFLDLEHDGYLDLVVANGAVTASEALARAGDPRPFHEVDSLFRGVMDGESFSFRPVSDGAGAHFARSEIGRGLAAGDLDQDGDTDLVLFNNGGPLRVLLSSASQRGGRWLGIEVEDTRFRRSAIGVQVRVELDDGRRQVAWIARDGSYAVANDPRRLFGLGQANVLTVEAIWPDGWVERIDAPAAGSYHLLSRSEGSR